MFGAFASTRPEPLVFETDAHGLRCGGVPRLRTPSVASDMSPSLLLIFVTALLAATIAGDPPPKWERLPQPSVYRMANQARAVVEGTPGPNGVVTITARYWVKPGDKVSDAPLSVSLRRDSTASQASDLVAATRRSVRACAVRRHHCFHRRGAARRLTLRGFLCRPCGGGRVSPVEGRVPTSPRERQLAEARFAVVRGPDLACARPLAGAVRARGHGQRDDHCECRARPSLWHRG